MAEQNQGQGGQGQQGQQQQRQQRREPPRLVVIHHDPDKKVKRVGDRFENSIKIWVIKENVDRPEEVYCSFRVNHGDPTNEQLLGEDGVCTEVLRFAGMRPHVEVRLRWRHDPDPQWRSLGPMEFPDPDKDPNEELLFHRLYAALKKELQNLKQGSQERQERRREKRQRRDFKRAQAAARQARSAQQQQNQPGPDDQI